jgi:hypothetical protein
MSHKQMKYFFVSLLFCNVYASEKNYSYIAGTVTALVIGKLSYDYFYYHHVTPEQTILQCQSTFTTIQHKVQYYHTIHRNDAQISNLELKEKIVDTSRNSYPFLEYYRSLQHILFMLRKHSVTVTQQLADIKKHEKNMQYKSLILQLETEGKNIKQYIAKTISLVIMLKMRIQSCKEYHEDCYYYEEKMSTV